MEVAGGAVAMANFLQWGALGLLSLVLIGVGLWVRQSLSKNQQFMEKLATGAIETQIKYTEAFQAVSMRAITVQEASTAAQQASTAANEKMAACMEALNTQNLDSHRNLANGLSKLRKGQLEIMRRQVQKEKQVETQ